MPLKDIFDLARHVGATVHSDGANTARSVGHRLYKDTVCGISFYWSPPLGESLGYVVVSGYAEGTDAECPPHELRFPFDAESFDTAVDAADEEGCDLFDEVHGEEDEDDDEEEDEDEDEADDEDA